MSTHSIALRAPANEMAQEEVRKQVAFLSRTVSNVRFSENGSTLLFDVAEGDAPPDLDTSAQQLANQIARALRSLERKVIFSSTACSNAQFADNVSSEGIHFLGVGQVALSGVPLRLFRYFDRVFEAFGHPWRAEPLMTPTLIPSKTLARCDYFRSFPHNVTFASHLREDAHLIDGFRKRHQNIDDVDQQALADMERPEACLSPAVCYHVYHLRENQVLPASGAVYGICGSCFRYESSNLTDLRRLWNFTMREVVFLGGREYVLAQRETSIGMMSDFLEQHRLAGEIRTASDPFFVAPEATSKTYFQLSSDSKFEVSLLLRDDSRLAVGSHNYHSDFFGRVFHTDVEGAGAMHSVCVAFGLERWVHAFMDQHGSDPKAWPDPVRNAPEFQ
jgi:seryl-tRNA synthetase